MSCDPPKPVCPPPPVPPCPSVCTPPPPVPPCRPKPILKGLHWAQTKTIIATALGLSAIGGTCVYMFLGRPRRNAYKVYYETTDIEDQGNEMARKGLFQGASPESLIADRGQNK